MDNLVRSFLLFVLGGVLLLGGFFLGKLSVTCPRCVCPECKCPNCGELGFVHKEDCMELVDCPEIECPELEDQCSGIEEICNTEVKDYCEKNKEECPVCVQNTCICEVNEIDNCPTTTTTTCKWEKKWYDGRRIDIQVC